MKENSNKKCHTEETGFDKHDYLKVNDIYLLHFRLLFV